MARPSVDRVFAPVLGLFFALFAAPGEARPANVVLVVLDAARADHFGSYGYALPTTPRLDAFAVRGATFLNAFSQATRTAPSVPALLSSRYLSIELFSAGSGPWGFRRVRPARVFRARDPEQSFLPELLAARGYRTALFSDHPFFTDDAPLRAMFDVNRTFAPSSGDPALFTQAAAWVRENADAPFFLYLHALSPHEPYLAPPFPGSTHPAYDGNLRAADAGAGEVFDALDAVGVASNTLVLVTSDHGENLGEHGNATHGGPPWDSATRVPLIVVYPPRVPARVKSAALVETIDIVPTALDALGLSAPSGVTFDGESLLPVLSGARGKDAVFTPVSVRTAEHKYMIDLDFLADVKMDPGETNNLAARRPALRARLKRLHALALRHPRERYERSVSTEPPSSPFAYELIELKPAASAPWSVDAKRREVRRAPFIGRAPLTLRVPVPDGDYAVSLSALGELAERPLDYRFAGERPSRATPVRILRQAGFPTAVLYALGRVKTRGGKTTVSLDLTPVPGESAALTELIFDPSPTPAAPPSDEERRALREKLRAAGYLP